MEKNNKSLKIFLKYFAVPIAIALIAGALYLVDALIAPCIVEGASFMWVAFSIWTIFYAAKIDERIRGLIGILLGFVAAVVMMLITGSFSANIATISISSLLGVFVVNFFVMFLDKAKKVWLNSLSGIFAGIFLTFSGLGVGLSPLSNVTNAFVMLGTILLYAVLGMLCGFLSILVTNKTKSKVEELEKPKNIEKN